LSLRRGAAAALAALASLASAQPTIPAFSSAKPGGELPAPWRAVALPHRRAADVRLVADEGRTVLRVHSDRAFGTAAITLDLEAPVISWRWKIDRVVEGAKLGTKEGDDFAARVYVTFEIPAQDLTFGERARLGLTRLLYGDVPSAAICYVWDNRHARGHAIWSPHAERVRMVVLQSGNAQAGRWVDERRDVAADFRAAFGRAAPRITGIAAGNDSDQSGESVTAWFGDFRVEPR
jgi:hypothetical protein